MVTFASVIDAVGRRMTNPDESVLWYVADQWSRLQLHEPIKKIGEFDVPIKLHRDVTAAVKVKVVPEGQPETPAAQ